MIEERLNEIIGDNDRKYRYLYCVNHGKLNQKDLAEKIGVSTPLIGSLESTNIKQGVSVYNLYKISKALEIPIEKFFEDNALK